MSAESSAAPIPGRDAGNDGLSLSNTPGSVYAVWSMREIRCLHKEGIQIMIETS